jgi:transposase
VAKVALDHGLNANLVHKWRRQAARVQAHDAAPAPAATPFVPVALAPSVEPLPDIRIDVRRGQTAITVSWPMAAATDCANWMRELLR